MQENAARKVDIIKIWVDDRMGTVTKLSPELYTAVIDEAHKHGLRVIAHIYTLEDAKATLRAGLDAFAHGVRDKDVDDEFMALVKQHREPGPRAEHARSRRGGRISTGCGRSSRPRSSRRFKRATPTVPTPRRSGASRRATSRR